ncbi:lipid II flippase MurJ, partial [Acinetobacter baumannii]
MFGFSLPSVAQLISQKFASPYPVGANSVVSYSNNLMQAPAGIFGQSLALAIFPVLTQFYAQNRMDLYCKQVEKTLRTVVYLSVP